MATASLAKLDVLIGADWSALDKEMRKVGRKMEAFGQSMDRVGSRLTRSLTLPIAALGAGAVKAAADFDSLRIGLEAVTGSAAEAERQIKRLREIAKLPAVDLNQATQASMSFQAIGKDAAFAERMIRGVANAVALSGGGAEEFGGVMRQMRQIASLGRLMGEELNVILENAPAMAKALQNAFGTTSAEAIRELNLSADELLTRLVSGAEELPQVMGGAKNSFDNLRQATIQAADAIGEKLLPAIVPLVESLSAALEKVQALNPETIRMGLAIAAGAAAMGPLAKGVALVTAAITALLAKTVTLTALATGGLTLVLGALAAVWTKRKLDEWAEAAEKINGVAEALRGLSKEQLIAQTAELDRRTEALRNMPQTEFVRETIAANEAEMLRLAQEFNSRFGTGSGGGAPAGGGGRSGGAANPWAALGGRQVGGVPFGSVATNAQSAGLTRGNIVGPVAVGPGSQGLITPRSRGPLAGIADAFKSQIGGLVAQFGPLAAAAAVLAPVFQGMKDALAPAIEALAEPLRAIGTTIGTIIAPVFELLAEPLQLISKLFEALMVPLRFSVALFTAYVAPGLKIMGALLRIVTTGLSYLMEGLGYAVRAIGKLIDSLPFVSAQWMIDAGQEMIDAAKGARESFDTAAEGADRLAESLSNIPRVLPLALRRFQAAGQYVPPNSSPPGGGGGGGGGGTGPGNDDDRQLRMENVTFNLPNVTNPAEFELWARAKLSRGGGTAFALQGV